MDSLQVFSTRWPDNLEMYDVVGESYRAQNVRQAGQYIRANATYLPQRACLVPLHDVPEDPRAVGVFFVQKSRTWLGTKKDSAVHVGFLPSDQAAKFRRDMKALGYEGFCMECAGCVVDNEKTKHPSVCIYVPLKFASLAKKGFLEDPANSPAWLSDGTPVRPRPITKRNGGDYTDDELRKVFCHRAQQRGWNSLPDRAEASLCEFREAGVGVLHFAVQEYAAGKISG
jgi:hypothetical protein